MRLVALAGALALLGAGGPIGAQTPLLRSQVEAGETLLEVEAEGEHLSPPDVMEISAGVVSTGRTAAEAMKANSAVANRIAAAARANGLSPGDLRTSALSLNPAFAEGKDDEEKPRIVGYRAANTLNLRIRDLAAVPRLIDALIKEGSNDIDGPKFSLSDDTQARKAARQKAVGLARAQAQDYAEALGMRIVRVLRVSERQARSETLFQLASNNGPPVEPGEVETSVTVWVDFALGPAR
jgi:uncharacterized protein YggE